jgi:hypothetical protein
VQAKRKAGLEALAAKFAALEGPKVRWQPTHLGGPASSRLSLAPPSTVDCVGSAGGVERALGARPARCVFGANSGCVWSFTRDRITIHAGAGTHHPVHLRPCLSTTRLQRPASVAAPLPPRLCCAAYAAPPLPPLSCRPASAGRHEPRHVSAQRLPRGAVSGG